MPIRQKIVRELIHMSAVIVLLAGLGIYAFDFVVAGLMAKPELNFTIVGTFLFGATLAFGGILALFNEVKALDAIRADFMFRRRALAGDVYATPAQVFARPNLLGYGYRLITEELQSRGHTRLPTETVHLLVKDVDQRISDMRSTLTYFGGLLVFLGLLGAFMGLMKTVHAVGDLIGAMDLTGAGGAGAIARMIEGMKAPLNGMSVGFSSSLFGLLFSMALGVLDRFVVNAMKAVRNDFEATLINMAELHTADPSTAGAQGGGAQAAGGGAFDTRTAESIDRIRTASERTYEQLTDLSVAVSGLTSAVRSQRLQSSIDGVVGRAFEEMIATQREMAAQMARFADAAIAMADARADSDGRTADALERQIELLSDIAKRPAALARPARAEPANDLAHLQMRPAPAQPQPPIAAFAPEPPSRWDIFRRIAQILAPPEPPTSASRIPPRPANSTFSVSLQKSVEATQSMAREVLRRFDPARSEDRRVVRQLARRQDAIVAELSDLADKISAVMRTHDVAPRDRIDELRVELVNLQRSAAHDFSRIEQQINANRRMAERAEIAASTTTSRIEDLTELAMRRASR